MGALAKQSPAGRKITIDPFSVPRQARENILLRAENFHDMLRLLENKVPFQSQGGPRILVASRNPSHCTCLMHAGCAVKFHHTTSDAGFCGSYLAAKPGFYTSHRFATLKGEAYSRVLAASDVSGPPSKVASRAVVSRRKDSRAQVD